MTERPVTVGDDRGIHGRTARTIVSIVLRHDVECTIRLLDGSGRVASGRSILTVLSLGAAFGAALELHVSGARAEEAADVLAQYIEHGPYDSYVSIDEGSNSDPVFRDMSWLERNEYLERLNAVQAANIPIWKRPWGRDYGAFAMHVASDCERRGIPIPPEIQSRAESERRRIQAGRLHAEPLAE